MAELDAREANRLARQASITRTALLDAIDAAILSAAIVGDFTLTYDVVGHPNVDIQFVITTLRFRLYTVLHHTDIGVNELIINW